MKATTKAHPIQGLVKYHGVRDMERRMPYYDSISVCTISSHTQTTIEFRLDADEDAYVIGGEEVEGHGVEYIQAIIDRIRELASFNHRTRLENENFFLSNIGFGSSASGFTAAAMAFVETTDLDMTRPGVSTIAHRGSASAAHAITGAFSHLYLGMNDTDCRSERIETDLEDDLRIVAARVPAYKETEQAYAEVADSHTFQARMAHIHAQIDDMHDALYDGDFDAAFELTEYDPLSLAAMTMTGPADWVYWQPCTTTVFNAVRKLRNEEGVPVYFPTDTGASAYINTTEEHVDRVEEAVADCDAETDVWGVGSPAEVLDESEVLF